MMVNSDRVSLAGISFNSFATILAAGCYDGKAGSFDWSIKGVLPDESCSQQVNLQKDRPEFLPRLGCYCLYGWNCGNLERS